METILEAKHVSINYKMGDFRDIGLKEWVLRHLTHNYEIQVFQAVHDVSFDLKKGEMLGIIGSNGAGKSTLLKAISGIMEPSEGTIIRQGNIAALLELASGFDGELTVKENAYLRGAMLGYTRDFMDQTYESIIDFAELKDFENRPFKQLSSGMQARLAFSIASLVQPDILILDEVLSVGDGAFQEKSAKKMREIINGGATTILVSHSIEQIRKLCSKVLWLHKGTSVAYGTDVARICDAYEEFLSWGDLPKKEQNDDGWKQELYSPTMIKHIGRYWFIVDCWHHRILYSENINKDIEKWKVFSDSLLFPHSIDSDGELYLCDDVMNKRVLVWKEDGHNNFAIHQILQLPDISPYFVKYYVGTNTFYVNGANEGKVIELEKKNGGIRVKREIFIPDYIGKYFRTFNIIDDEMYLTSGPGYITRVELKSEKLNIISRYSVPDELCGMNYIDRDGEYFYISVYQDINGNISPKFVRIKDLEELKFRKYEDLYGVLDFHGVPFYFTSYEEWHYITEIDKYNGIKRYHIVDNCITDVENLMSFEKPSHGSRMRKRYIPSNVELNNKLQTRQII